MEEKDYMTVKEFADETRRFPNQIYDLINKGNAYGKLKTKLVEGKIKVLRSELENYVFNKADAVRKDYEQRLRILERQVSALTYLVEKHLEKE